MRKHLNLSVTGKVQGVWYRKSSQDKALELGLVGFVMNRTDGSVYIEAEGDESQLNTFVEWCFTGPELSRVENIIIEESGIRNFESFEILR